MLIPCIPWVIYFALNGALYDIINVYFFVNISSYSSQVSIFTRIYTALKDSLMYVNNLKLFSTITIIGYIYTMISKNVFSRIYEKIAITVTILISVIGVYYGANHIYYFLILMPFVILGIICFANIIEKIVNKKYINIIKLIAPIYLILIVVLCCNTSNNFEFRKTKKEDLLQYKFAEIIKQKPNATLLNYGFLDGGFYTVANIVPNVKYFHKPNISYESYPEIMNEQNRYIKEKVVDFVVIKVEKEEDSNKIEYLNENYKKIDSVYVQNVNSYYMLFQVI